MPVKHTSTDWASTTALVTGASRGIGRRVVNELLNRGAAVGAMARSASDLDDLKATALPGARLEALSVDVADRGAVERAVAEFTDRLGAIEVLVNNAGIGLYGPVVELDPDDAERLMQVNYLGTVYAIRAVLPSMVDRGHGHIVNVGSIAGRIGSPFEAAYAASKFAVTGFTEALAVEAAPFGVRVSLINPGPVDTSFFEARGHPYARRRPRPLDPGRVAGAVIQAIERGTAERTIPASLGAAVVIRHLLSPLFRRGAGAAMRGEIAALRASRARRD